MKNKKIFIVSLVTILFILIPNLASAQLDSTMYGISRNATGIKFAKVNPATGVVTDISTSDIATGYSLSGSCLNPYANTYTFFGGTVLNTVDISTGISISTPTITTPPGTQYFQFPFFNNSDSTIYGLSRGSQYDSTLMTYVGVLYLSTINTSTGVVSAISTSSIGQAINMNLGYTVDPYNKIYYFSDGSNKIKGIDMYTGTIYSNTTLSKQVSNIVYNCIDNNMYGMVSTLFYDTILDPDSLLPPMIVLDSAALQLARIDITTGNITILTSGSVGASYTLNAGVTIDPINNLYYYQGSGRLIGISMTTGNIVNNSIINNISGAPYFDLMRHYQNCYYAETRRTNTTSINTATNSNAFMIAPNPASDNISLISENTTQIESIYIMDMMGKIVANKSDLASTTIDISNLSTGHYILNILTKDGAIARQKFIKE